MKKLILTFLMAFAAFFIVACGGGGEETSSTDEGTTTEDTLSGESTEATTESSTVKLAPGEIPFDFPKVNTKGLAGQYVLCPSYKAWTTKLEKEDPTKEPYIFYNAKMSKPGEVESEIDFTFDGKQMMPNSMFIPIPKGSRASKGNVVLTWWQTGSGMQRAIVTDDSNPAEPVVRYLDLNWDNPAKDKESGKGIGQTEYKLKPDSFVILNNLAMGSKAAAKEGNDWKSVQLIKEDGDKKKVLTLGFAGKMKVYDKEDIAYLPQIIKLKAGDKVKAVFVGTFKDATVVRTDDKMGVVFVKFDKIGKDEKPVSFGEVVTFLPEAK